ncbi:MAG: hypothetical protein IJW67_03680, partial [Blautia sp.]|nr:hypothetical protein [Blautia sp.]
MENRTSGNLEADHSDRTGNKSLEQLKAELEKEKAHYKELEKDPRKPKEKKKKNTDSSVSPPADPIPYGQLDQFHIMRIKDGKYYPRDTFDYVIVREIKSRYHLFVLNGKAYWYMGGVYKIDDSGTLSQDIIENFIYPEFKDFRHKQKIYKLLLSDYHIQKNIEDINNFPATWINFQNGFYDARQKIFIEHDWKYLSINQIPHDYCEKSVEEIESSITYKYLSDLIPDEADRFMFFQYCGYSMTTDTK